MKHTFIFLKLYLHLCGLFPPLLRVMNKTRSFLKRLCVWPSIAFSPIITILSTVISQMLWRWDVSLLCIKDPVVINSGPSTLVLLGTSVSLGASKAEYDGEVSVLLHQSNNNHVYLGTLQVGWGTQTQKEDLAIHCFLGDISQGANPFYGYLNICALFTFLLIHCNFLKWKIFSCRMCKKIRLPVPLALQSIIFALKLNHSPSNLRS